MTPEEWEELKAFAIAMLGEMAGPPPEPKDPPADQSWLEVENGGP